MMESEFLFILSLSFLVVGIVILIWTLTVKKYSIPDEQKKEFDPADSLGSELFRGDNKFEEFSYDFDDKSGNNSNSSSEQGESEANNENPQRGKNLTFLFPLLFLGFLISLIIIFSIVIMD